MYLEKLEINNHPILGNQCLDFINPKTGKPYGTIAFVGENACGKTTLLDLLFNYSSSQYVVNKHLKKSVLGVGEFQSLFLRQNSLYVQCQNDLNKSIIGDSTNPIISGDYQIGNNSLFRGTAFVYPDKLKRIINIFGDETIKEICTNKMLFDVDCGGKALELIKGKSDKIDISKLSSGQQELIIKLSNLSKTLATVDYILIDEPETSLHPRWQRDIVKTIKNLLRNEDDCPQIFLATHSEKVLESLIDEEDVLIYRFSKNNKKIEIKEIDQLKLSLPKTTFAELDFSIFNIDTFDYHDQLFSYLSELYDSDSVSYIDKQIVKSPLYSPNLFKKWEGTKKAKDPKTHKFIDVPSITASLPAYIRNYFHHPKEGKKPTEEELHLSIIFLQKLILEKKDV